MNAARKGLLTLLKIADLSVVIASFLVAMAFTDGASDPQGWLAPLEMRIQLKNALFMALYLVLWHFVLRRCQLYRSYRLSGVSRELRDIQIAVAAAATPL